MSTGLQKEGQLKERSEGDQAQWQTALGEVGGGVLINFIKLAAVVLAPPVPDTESLVSGPRSRVCASIKAFVYLEFCRFVKICGALKRHFGPR